MSAMSRRHVVYRFYDADREVLYIGITINPPARFTQHQVSKTWWDDVARITLEKHPSRESALLAEREAIITERPHHNIAHNDGYQTWGRLVMPTLAEVEAHAAQENA